MSKKGSKNNIANRGAGAAGKSYDGKAVKPVKLINGNKRFIAAAFDDGKLVKDQSGSYIPYASIQ